MGAQTSWTAEASAVNHTASFEVEDTLHNKEFCSRGMPRIIGTSTALQNVLDMVRMVAPTDSTVLIQGETGTGKELIARAVHDISSRCGRPFVKLNCAAIPLDLLESELFGHEKGAFTGAIAHRVGRFELADKGTLFLDEIGDIPLALQPKLLRVLQEREFERLGSNRTHQVDVRLVAATNRNLLDMVKRKEFRSDLYYRLNVFPILVPPLRARCEDIPALVEHFLKIYARRMDKQIEKISPEAMSKLTSYAWPGNIRELQNFIERSVILYTGNNLRSSLESSRRVGGDNGAAARLGVKRSTLYSRMEKLGISRSDSRPIPSYQRRTDLGAGSLESLF
jgi:formate hydrogenlyase transcriptional activator